MTNLNELFAEFLTKVVRTERIPFSEPGEETSAGDASPINGTSSTNLNPSSVNATAVDERGSWLKTSIDLKTFGEKIKTFLEIQVEVSEIKTVHDIDFLKVNAQPIKQAISTWVTKWLYVHTQYLQNYVGDRLNDIFNLLQDVNSGINYQIFVFICIKFIVWVFRS